MGFKVSRNYLRQFLDYCGKNGFRYSYDQFVMKFFPYAIAPAARSRLSHLKKFIDYSLSSKGRRILDAGCGTGWVSFWLKNNVQRDFDLICADLSDQSLTEARMLFSFFNQEIPIIKSDICQLPFPSSYFHAVIAFSVLEHIPRVELALEEMNRVLKPNGYLIVNLPNKFGSYSLLNDQLLPFLLGLGAKKGSIESYHEHLHGFNWWREKFECYGFEVINTQNIEFLTTYFVNAARLLRLSRRYLYPITFLDDKVAKLIPKLLASDWAIALTKR